MRKVSSPEWVGGRGNAALHMHAHAHCLTSQHRDNMVELTGISLYKHCKCYYYRNITITRNNNSNNHVIAGKLLVFGGAHVH